MNTLKQIPAAVQYLFGALVSLVPAWALGACLVALAYGLRFATLPALQFEINGGLWLLCGLMVGRLCTALPASPLKRFGTAFGVWSCFLGFTAIMVGTVACAYHIVTVHVIW